MPPCHSARPETQHPAKQGSLLGEARGTQELPTHRDLESLLAVTQQLGADLQGPLPLPRFGRGEPALQDLAQGVILSHNGHLSLPDIPLSPSSGPFLDGLPCGSARPPDPSSTGSAAFAAPLSKPPQISAPASQRLFPHHPTAAHMDHILEGGRGHLRLEKDC